ncbi:MAG: PilZ domain-containing protein [Lachnospiraceae bacterium]|nr:PilZ domain-containing protein [Lachnospiraceae bacterium]
MYINEIPENSKISIDFNTETSAANIETTIKKRGKNNSTEKVAVANVTRVKGKVINLNGFKGKITVSYIKEGSERPEVWNFVRVHYDRDNKEYLISTTLESKRVERRRTYRVAMGVNATLKLENDDKEYSCTIHDISVTGIGLRMPPIEKGAIGKRFKLSFKDTKEYVAFTINCKCVREAPCGKNLMTYGCTFRATDDLLTYIRRKQRAEKEKEKQKKR